VLKSIEYCQSVGNDL